MSFEQHEYNFKDLHRRFYDTDLKLYYDKYVKEIYADESLTNDDRYNFLRMFKDYYNTRVASINQRDLEVKALNMFNLYLKNGKDINYEFLQDVKLSNVVRSYILCKKYLETLSPDRITKMYYMYWLYIGKVAISEGSNIDTIVEEGHKVLRELIDYKIIGEKTYNMLCDRYREDLTKGE